MVDVTLRGRESQAVISRSKSIVRLYFVDVEYAQEYENYQNHAFYVQGAALRLPRLGEYLEVKEVVALDLINKTRYKGRNILVTAGEGGEQMSKLIQEAVRNGQSLKTIDLQKAYTSKAIEKFSDEELLEIMAKRGLSVASAPHVESTLIPTQVVFQGQAEEVADKSRFKK